MASRILLGVFASAAASASAGGFVSTSGTNFVVDGSPFSFVGTNSYYLLYTDPFMLDNVMQKAALNNFSVLRTWAWLDIGYPNGTGSVDGSGSKNGVWFRAWDPEQRTVVTNESNLVHLDAVVAAAKKWGIRLILTLTNNWQDFGGMDQVSRDAMPPALHFLPRPFLRPQTVRWATWADPTYNSPHHDDFYVSPQLRQWYKDWAATLTARVNTITGVAYKDEPAIFAWELANEPRCYGSGVYSSTGNCTLNYAKYEVQPVVSGVACAGVFWRSSSVHCI